MKFYSSFYFYTYSILLFPEPSTKFDLDRNVMNSVLTKMMN